jgi:hypothetical protein
MKKVLIFLLIFIFYNSHLSSNDDLNKNNKKPLCFDKNGNKFIESLNDTIVKKIEIDIDQYRKWIINSTKIITSRGRFIDSKYKKRFNASLNVKYDNNVNCYLKGRIRHSGDAKDHIKLFNNSIIQSLDINLKSGHIQGITKFKLYIPGVRGIEEDEIIQTLILKKLNFISPRTKKINVRVNELNLVMLFQEKAAKEMLENNNRREGPILEADQKFFFKLVSNIPDNQLSNWSVGTPILRSKSAKAMLSKQTNAKIIQSSDNYLNMSLNSINNLNSIFLYYSNRFDEKKNNFHFFDYDLDNTLLGFFEPEKILKLDIYNLLMQSTNSHHALSASNRKFYWNSIEGYFEPINYDSNPFIDGEAPTTTSSSIRFPVSKYYPKAFFVLQEELINLDITDLKNQMVFSGYDLSSNQIQKKINKIILNLELLKNGYSKISKDIEKHNNYKPIDGILSQFNSNLEEIDPAVLLIKESSDKKNFKICKIYFKDCENWNYDKNLLEKLLNGSLNKNNRAYQFVGKDLNFDNFKHLSNLNKKNINNTKIYYDNGITIELNSSETILKINQNKIGSRAYLIGGSLENIQIEFQGLGDTETNNKEIASKFPIDINGLTGCLSLVNLKLKNISIKSNNSNCEDSLNLINVNGEINTIKIVNSYMDGLDIDFSNLSINEIDISDSSNDCLDFSYGVYYLKKANLSKCGDKGLSLGEKSFLKLEDVYVDNADTGIASKDSSIAKLENVSVSEVKICVSSYNKKQEFDGGSAYIKNLSCKNFNKKLDVDNLSTIVVENEL